MKAKPTYKELEQEVELLRQKLNASENEEEFPSYFMNNKVAMLQVDSETKQIINANDSAINFYGFSKPELLQKTISIYKL